ncbi:MAG: precorrin-6y C5,15-methyltransferase (decarboxylating) subunit CbiE [Nitratireductor sp.]|nr:precorrin-6y C5,15-methyltransferase (decarboxylating) subunit CbiE [Nitratireductor sp.]
MSAWMDVIGIGEDGMDGLSPAARALVESAEVIIGGDRHHQLSANVSAERVAWPSPFDAMIDTMKSFRGRRLVVLVTGDPLWFSVGARMLRSIPADEIRFHPQLSAFQWASCRLGWSLPDIELLTIHGRPAEQFLPHVAPGVKMILLTKDATSPATVAALLTQRGYGESAMTVLGALGGPRETRQDGFAREWAVDAPEFPAFHVLAIDLVAGEGAQILPRTGLPDSVFEHDGKMTKQAVRALTLAKLVPHRDGLLWDIGSGCGSVAIEWMRAAPEARAIGIEPRIDRRAVSARNAIALGTPALKLIEGQAPEALAGLPAPDAVFLGGGLSEAVFEASFSALKPFGRLVANAVTLESEAILLKLFERHGGELVRIATQSADPVGPYHGWRAAMPVTQWSISKPGAGA